MSKTIKGDRLFGESIVLINWDGRVDLLPPMIAYPDGFLGAYDWGNQSTGALQLAYSIMRYFLSRERADAIYGAYLEEVIATLKFDHWEISEEDIKIWINRQMQQRLALSYFQIRAIGS